MWPQAQVDLRDLAMIEDDRHDRAQARPITVAQAAPAMPIFGKPSRPKMRIGSRMIFVIAPTSCVIME